MRIAHVLAAASTLGLGLTALALQAVDTGDDTPKKPIDRTPTACFDHARCGDRDVLCPSGPDCFAPEVCFDRDVICPADAACDCSAGCAERDSASTDA